MKFTLNFKKGVSFVLSLSILLSTSVNFGFINNVEAAERQNLQSEISIKINKKNLQYLEKNINICLQVAEMLIN